MIRSTPPRSANLADIPVPAPAPSSGLPAATWSRSRRSDSLRAMNGIRSVLLFRAGPLLGKSRHQPVGDGIGEGWVVDMQLQLDQLHRWHARVAAQRVEERRVG